MADHKYANWHEEPKTKQNLYAVLFGYLYVGHNGHIYEYVGIQEDMERADKIYIVLSDINDGFPVLTSWREILESSEYSIVRKEA